MEDFINPKSTITPAIASTGVALISGALFKTFGITVPISAIIFSFLICIILFHSK